MQKLFILACAALVMAGCAKQKDPTMDRSDFVAITDVVPDAILEIRYYSTYNFVGERIDGYDAPIALMTREAADSLRAVSDDLRRHGGYRLKIWDAYRPQRAVNHFIRWAENLQDTAMKRIFYPMSVRSTVEPRLCPERARI